MTIDSTTILHKQLIDLPSSGPSPEESLQSKEDGEEGIPKSRSTGDNAQAGTRRRWLTLATGAVDRAGDILVISGLDSTNFLKNPQFLWQHGASGSLISTIGRVLKLESQSKGGHSPDVLMALVEYASPNISSLAEQVYQMDLAGLLPANSIGFRPIEYEANDYGGYTFSKWELIECSKVELPMNPDAVDSSARKNTSNPDDRGAISNSSIEKAAEWLVR